MLKLFLHRWRCPFAWSLLLLLIVLVLTGILGPVFWQLHQLQAELEEAQGQVAHYQQIIAKKPAILAQLKEIKRFESTQSLQFPQATPALVAAELQELVKNIAEGNEGKLISTQILNADTTEKLPKVSLKVQIKGSLEAVSKTFHALESHQPLLFIDDVYIRAQTRHYRVRPLNANNASGNTESPPESELDVRFDLSAYIKES